MSNFYISASQQKSAIPKVYTFGFKKYGISNMLELAELTNTYSVAAPVFENGHRASNKVIEGGNVILIDCDKRGQAEQVEARLKPYCYVKVPSRSYNRFKYKWHFIVPTQVPLSKSRAAMEYQVRQFFSQVGITDDMIDTTGSFDIARQFAPAVAEKYTETIKDTGEVYTTGMTLEEAMDVTVINETDLYAPIIQDVPEELDNDAVQSCRPKRTCAVVDTDVNTLEDIEDGFLDRTKSIYFEGKKISLDDAETMIYEAIDLSDNSVVSGFGCPVCNPKHNSDPTRGYGFAFIHPESGNVVFKCTGNECNLHPYYTLQAQNTNHIITTEMNIQDKDIAIANDFKTRWETTLGNVSNPMLETNWRQNFNVFDNVIENNVNGGRTTKYICPSPTGSGKSQQVIHKAITLQNTNIKSLIVVLRTSDADDIAHQIQTQTSDEYVAVYHTQELTKQDVTLAHTYNVSNYQCVVITHNMFLKRGSNIVEGRDFVVIDESINAINNFQITLNDINNMTAILKKSKLESEPVYEAIVGLRDALVQIDKDLSNNSVRLLCGNDGMRTRIPDPSEAVLSVFNNPSTDLLKLAVRMAGTDGQNIALRTRYTEILHQLSKSFQSWMYVLKVGELSLNTASEIIPTKSVVIMDATATVNSAYSLYSKYQKNLVVLPKVECRNYQNVTIHFARTSTGRTTLLDKDNKKDIEGLIKNIVSNTVAADEILLVTFKELEQKLKTYEVADGRTIHVDHFGNLTGTNKYNTCSHIFIYGLPHKPREVAINTHTLAKGSARSFINNPENKKEISEIINSDLTAEVIQAINRTRCRRTIDSEGNCDATQVYMTALSDSASHKIMKEYLEHEMPNVKIGIPWNIADHTEIELTRTSLAESFIVQLEYVLSDPNLPEVELQDILRDLDINAQQFRNTVKKSKVYQLAMEHDFTTYEKPRIGYRGQAKKTKDTFYLKR